MEWVRQVREALWLGNLPEVGPEQFIPSRAWPRGVGIRPQGLAGIHSVGPWVSLEVRPGYKGGLQ